MTAFITRLFGAVLYRAGVPGVNAEGRRLWRSVLFPPMPCVDAARPADRP
jgi:hypothetical protein